MERQIKENKILLNNNLKLILGTLQRKTPKSIYLHLSCWIKPTIYDDDTIKVFKNILNNLKNNFKKCLNKHEIINKYLYDYDCSIQTLNVESFNFLKIEIVFLQNSETSFNDIKNKYKTDITNCFNIFIDSLIKNDFIIQQKKKGI